MKNSKFDKLFSMIMQEINEYKLNNNYSDVNISIDNKIKKQKQNVEFIVYRNNQGMVADWSDEDWDLVNDDDPNNVKFYSIENLVNFLWDNLCQQHYYFINLAWYPNNKHTYKNHQHLNIIQADQEELTEAFNMVVNKKITKIDIYVSTGYNIYIKINYF